ncbi:MAG: hypothetical protein IKZ78_04495 [Firmicutes bacterium]|nr:hypothetical protein [Bacillota bacterium]MBR6025716.1 hypothetical protein [Bacillota bacterium]
MSLRKTETYASKKLSFGVIAFCIALMASVVAKGVQLDREDAERVEKERLEKEAKEAANQDNHQEES